jgi:CHAD domain-containing protein
MSRPAGQYDLFRKRLDAFADDLERIHDDDVEARHRARVASRRLRELLPVLELNGGAARRLGRRLRRVTRQLGRVRELDVLTSVVDDLARDRRFSPAALTQVGTDLAGARSTARESLVAKLPVAKMERLVRRLGRVAKRLRSDSAGRQRRRMRGPRRAWVTALEVRAARRAVNLRSAIETAGAVYVPARLHDVRIALKKFRYAAELVLEVRPQRSTSDMTVLKTAQDVLGRLRDLELLAARGRQVQASLAPITLTDWHRLGSLVYAVEDDCRQLHARYMHDRAKLIAIAERMGAATSDTALLDGRAAG